MAEVGFQGQEADTLAGLLVPAGTPKATVNAISREIQRILAQPEITERIAGLGFDVISSTPEQFAAQIKVEVEKWAK